MGCVAPTPQVDPFFVPLTEEEREEFGEVSVPPLAVGPAIPARAAVQA